MEFKGTIEKWDLQLSQGNRCFVSSGEDKAICDVFGSYHSNVTNNEQLYNSLLISNAPELLKELIKISVVLKEETILNKTLGCGKDYSIELESIEKVIIKATEL